MKSIISVAIIALCMLSAPASARDMSTLWGTIGESAPRSAFDDGLTGAGRSTYFDQLNETAPRAATGDRTLDDRLAGE